MPSSSKEPSDQSTLEAPASPDGLRVRADMVEGKLNDSGSCAAHLRSAADGIERLREENQKLRTALKLIANAHPEAPSIAREALS